MPAGRGALRGPRPAVGADLGNGDPFATPPIDGDSIGVVESVDASGDEHLGQPCEHRQGADRDRERELPRERSGVRLGE